MYVIEQGEEVIMFVLSGQVAVVTVGLPVWVSFLPGLWPARAPILFFWPGGWN
jgi:hypothetical protein